MFDFLRRYWSVLREVATIYDVRHFEFQGGLIALLWGLWLLDPSALDPLHTIAFGLMRSLLPWPFWGVIFISLGLLQLGALIAGSPRFRKTGALAASFCWFFVSCFVLSSNHHSPEFPFVFMFTIGSTWGYWRIHVPCSRKSNGANPSNS